MRQRWIRLLSAVGLSAFALCGCLRLKHAALDRLPETADELLAGLAPARAFLGLYVEALK